MNSSKHAGPQKYKEALLYITSKSPANLLFEEPRAFEGLEQPDENYPTVMIDLDKTFQAVEGFGGAFTDASADNFAKLTPEAQEKFLKMNFDPDEGNGYTLCRSTIHSCD